MIVARIRDAGLVLAVLLVGVGCKKQIEITSVDAGAPVGESATNTGAQAQPTTDPPPTGGTETEPPLAPLAPLEGADPKKPASTAPAKPRGSASAATPASSGKKPETPAGGQPPECAAAARFCSHPAYATDSAIKNMCESKKAECLKKGGRI